jgi:hypothetical protein
MNAILWPSHGYQGIFFLPLINIESHSEISGRLTAKGVWQMLLLVRHAFSSGHGESLLSMQFNRAAMKTRAA